MVESVKVGKEMKKVIKKKANVISPAIHNTMIEEQTWCNWFEKIQNGMTEPQEQKQSLKLVREVVQYISSRWRIRTHHMGCETWNHIDGSSYFWNELRTESSTICSKKS